jgi:hypothetical protein
MLKYNTDKIVCGRFMRVEGVHVLCAVSPVSSAACRYGTKHMTAPYSHKSVKNNSICFVQLCICWFTVQNNERCMVQVLK